MTGLTSPPTLHIPSTFPLPPHPSTFHSQRPKRSSWAQPHSWERCHLWSQYPSRMPTCRWQIRCEFSASLDRRLTFDNHASAVVRSCNHHARAIRHIRHLLTLDLAQTLACSLIASRIDYCNSVLHSAPSSTIQKLQRVQNNAARIVLQAPRRSDVNSLLQTLHWQPVEQRR